MSLTIELKPAEQERLETLARRRGLPIQELAREMLGIRLPSLNPPRTEFEWKALETELAQGIEPFGIEVPEILADLVKTIDESKAMTLLGDDWDGEGSSGYAEQTWIRACEFLLRNAVRLWQEDAVLVDFPAVLKGPHGSVDIYWKTDRYSLLVNVPVDPGAGAEYYGCNAQGAEIKGRFNPAASNEWLLMWLKEE